MKAQQSGLLRVCLIPLGDTITIIAATSSTVHVGVDLRLWKRATGGVWAHLQANIPGYHELGG